MSKYHFTVPQPPEPPLWKRDRDAWVEDFKTRHDIGVLYEIDAYVREFDSGPLHIYAGDGNCEDHHIQSCLEWAKSEGNCWDVRVAELLLGMSVDDRQAIYDLS